VFFPRIRQVWRIEKHRPTHSLSPPSIDHIWAIKKVTTNDSLALSFPPVSNICSIYAEYMPNICSMGAEWMLNGYSMYAQWMLNRYSMDAEWMLKPTKERSRTIQIPTNQYKTSYMPHTNLQYKITIFSDICKKNHCFCCICKKFVVPLYPK
jgi:hypothetical protein